MTADVVELETVSSRATKAGWARTNPSGVTSVEANPPGVSFESMIIHVGPSY